MSYLENLPERVAHHIRSRFVCEFATVSRAGVPINSPLVPFASADLQTLDAATGLAYPAKAERVRRNPKIGMLFEGGSDDPVVSISALGAVRDQDFQANLERYLAEEILTPAISPQLVDYQGLTCKAIWYFTRILICATPVVVRWWDSRASTDSPPQEWRASSGSVWPQSDPAPAGAASNSPWAPAASWRDLAARALGRGAEAHLTLIDPEGFPLPVRVRAVRPTAEGFRLTMPAWLPWRGGAATLSFEGIEVVVGKAASDGRDMVFHAERPLPMHPLIAEPGQLLEPSPANRQALLERIDCELARRGLTRRPVMPAEPPEPTAGAQLRARSAFDFPDRRPDGELSPRPFGRPEGPAARGTPMGDQSTGRALQGMTAVVTGASSGIGKACAQVLAQDGAMVLIVGRNPDALATARAAILQQATDARIEMLAGDACEEDVVARALERAYALSNRLDILVPTVGGPEYKPVLQLDAAGFRRQFELNCVSAFLMVRHGAPMMVRGGAIVCISTAAVGQANMGLSAYGASKAALERFVRAAAFELGPAGIRINAVRPGATLSPDAIEARGLQHMAASYAAETPLGRIGEPLDVARVVRFLAGPEGAWVTGETVSADGGMQQGKAPDLGKVI